MTGPRGAALPRSSVHVGCAGNEHTLSWTAGELTAADHPDAERERALSALGADPTPCIELVDRFSRHRDDLDVLVLASRGAADPVATDGGGARMRSAGFAARPASYSSTLQVSRRGSKRPSAARGWTMYSPLAGSRSPGRPGLAGEPDDEVAALLAMGGGLPECLVATVAATWADRLDNRDTRIGAAMPSLRAALYGRAVAAMRSWLGDPHAKVDVAMCGPDEQPTLTSGQDCVRLALPFSWLCDVWAAGLSTVVGRFTLSATFTAPDRWTMQTVDAGFGPARSITIDASA